MQITSGFAATAAFLSLMYRFTRVARAIMAPRKPSIIHGPLTPAPVSMTFGDLLAKHARERGSRPAVISHHQNTTLTFQDLYKRSTALASSFRRYGVKRGDKVAILMGSRTEYLESFFACSKIGAALVLLNYAFVPEEIVSTLTPVEPKLFIVTPVIGKYNHTRILETLSQALPSLRALVLVNIDKASGFKPGPNMVDYESLLDHSQDETVIADDVSPHDIVNIQFTSGSTGVPKAAALSHYNIMNCGRYISEQMSVTDKDKVCLPVPLFHSFGLIIGICTSIWSGSAVVFPSEVFNATATVDCIAKYRCTGIYGVTTMFIEEMASPDFKETDRSSLEFGIMAGSAMPPDLLEKVTKQFPIPRLYTNWGMTELSSITTMTHHTDPLPKRIHTAGRLFPHFVAKIVEPNTGRVLPWGEKGEIVVSGYGVMRGGYLNNPEKTAESLKHHVEDLDPDGVGALDGSGALRTWLHTGDEGYLDNDGYFVITGRIKDIIIRGGENISPVEIEERLFAHPAIVQASVIGVPSVRLGEEIAAFVELRAGYEPPTDEELQEWVHQRLSRFKVPRYFWWIGAPDRNVPREWPQTASGKLRKPDLRVVGKELVESTEKPSLFARL